MSSVRIYNTSRELVARVPNAYGISYDKRANELWSASFSVPLDDPHIDDIILRYYAEIYDDDTRIGLFRIIRKKTVHDPNAEHYRFECEHVLATLLDTELADTTYAGPGTAATIGVIIALQSDWQLGTCDFTDQYLYEWERGTTLLKALLSIPERIQAAYLWTFDTTSYPWTINLTELLDTDNPTVYIDYGRNLREIERDEDQSTLVTRLYPHGAGAGADQIDITSVEPSGNAYIDQNTATYGTIIHHWTNQNYTTAQELYDAAVELLDTLSTPRITYRVTAAHLARLSGESIDEFDLGDVVRISDSVLGLSVDARIMRMLKGDITGKPGDVQLEIKNKVPEFDISENLVSNDLSNIDINDIPGGVIGALPTPPSDAGLYITTDYLGYHNGTSWATYLDNVGRIWADGATNHFHWDAPTGLLDMKGSMTLTGGIIAASITINSTGAVESANFVTGSAGFQINGDGTAEFNDVTVRGTLIAGDGSSIDGSYIGVETVTADRLYIDGNINFAISGVRNGILGINDLFYDPGQSTQYPHIELYSSGLRLHAGTLGGHTVLVYGTDDVTIQSDAGDVVLYPSGGSITVRGAGTTGDYTTYTNAGYLLLTVGGLTKYVQLYG